MKTFEVNFDGLPGPTHNFAGLASGNLASQENRYRTSHPRQAALEGLNKMKLLWSQGLAQGMIPPHERPYIPALYQLGYRGTDAQILESAARQNKEHLLLCSSSSAMWTANAATVSPSADTTDGLVHFTPANLVSHPHRRLEAEMTARLLQIIFPDPKYFVHHPPLADNGIFLDEGAANHMRLCESHDQPGLNVFVWGRRKGLDEKHLPSRFSARQSYEASSEVARLHALAPVRTMYLHQNPAAIDQGAFHNDVLAVSNERVLLMHESAFEQPKEAVEEMQRRFLSVSKKTLAVMRVSPQELPLEDAVGCYLFNSQIVTRPDGEMLLVAPAECADNKNARRVIERLTASGNSIREVKYVDLYESMRNGGGPACLRLRVQLTGKQLTAVHSGFLMNEQRFVQIEQWIHSHYRENLAVEELADPALLKESRQALDELTRILDCGPVYSFQKK